MQEQSWSREDNVNTIDYITIASTGNATDFGDLTVARRYAMLVDLIHMEV